jgi:thiamine-monophosphate kinase
MIDASDGFAADLRHLLRCSGVGVRLDGVPRADGATDDEALGGGEDYELLFTAPPSADISASFAASGLRPPIPVGRCTDDRDEATLAGRPLPSAGWEHPWD